MIYRPLIASVFLFATPAFAQEAPTEEDLTRSFLENAPRGFDVENAEILDQFSPRDGLFETRFDITLVGRPETFREVEQMHGFEVLSSMEAEDPFTVQLKMVSVLRSGRWEHMQASNFNRDETTAYLTGVGRPETFGSDYIVVGTAEYEAFLAEVEAKEAAHFAGLPSRLAGDAVCAARDWDWNVSWTPNRSQLGAITTEMELINPLTGEIDYLVGDGMISPTGEITMSHRGANGESVGHFDYPRIVELTKNDDSWIGGTADADRSNCDVRLYPEDVWTEVSATEDAQMDRIGAIMADLTHFVPQCNQIEDATVNTAAQERKGYVDIFYNQRNRAETFQYFPDGTVLLGGLNRQNLLAQGQINSDQVSTMITDGGVSYEFKNGCVVHFLTDEGYSAFLEPYKAKRSEFLNHISQGGGLELELDIPSAKFPMGQPIIDTLTASEDGFTGYVRGIQKSSWPTDYEIIIDLSEPHVPELKVFDTPASRNCEYHGLWDDEGIFLKNWTKNSGCPGLHFNIN